MSAEILAPADEVKRAQVTATLQKVNLIDFI